MDQKRGIQTPPDVNVLVAGFREGTVPGSQVMRSLLEKAGFEPEVADLPLTKQDGSQMTGEDGRPLAVSDYLEVAGRHGDALNTILGFVMMPDTHPAYERAQQLVAGSISAHLPPQPEQQ